MMRCESTLLRAVVSAGVVKTPKLVPGILPSQAIALGHPDKTRIYTCRGLCHVWMGEDSSAIRYFSKAIDADPQDVSSVYNRAQAYRSTCMWDLAVRYPMRAPVVLKSYSRGAVRHVFSDR